MFLIFKVYLEVYQVVKRGTEYHGCGEEYNVEIGKQYHLYYLCCWKEYQLGKRGRGLNFWEEYQYFKK